MQAFSGRNPEVTETVACAAFPEGIPADIAYGVDLHLKAREDQENDIVFELDE